MNNRDYYHPCSGHREGIRGPDDLNGADWMNIKRLWRAESWSDVIEKIQRFFNVSDKVAEKLVSVAFDKINKKSLFEKKTYKQDIYSLLEKVRNNITSANRAK